MPPSCLPVSVKKNGDVDSSFDLSRHAGFKVARARSAEEVVGGGESKIYSGCL